MKRTERAQRWKQHISDWRSSGLTQRAYCERESIAYERFKRWRKYFLGQQRAATQESPFIPVQVSEGLVARAGSARAKCHTPPLLSAGKVAIGLGNGRTLRLDAHFDERQLGQLIRLLEVLPC